MEDLSNMNMSQLSQMIINNPSMLQDLDEGVLCEIANKMNPYATVVNSNTKTTLFSFTNFKEDRMNAYKSLSLYRFLTKLIDEHEDWSEALKDKLGDQMDMFKAHMRLFKDHFMLYDKDVHVLPTSNADTQAIPPIDFISKWKRYETLNSKDLNETLDSNLLYKNKHQIALQVYGTFDTEEEARAFVDKHAKSVGFDIIMGSTNKWIILEDVDKSLDQVEFVGDQNTLINNMLSKMKEDKSVGEKMLQKRMATKKEENEREHGKHDANISNVMPNSTRQSSKEGGLTAEELNIYRERRLALGEDDLLTSNRVESYSHIPILNNTGHSLDKKMI